jgi:2-polyprenyl-6-methoxyphenol hydroxylase-like FAD-dependent oxidoreductase
LDTEVLIVGAGPTGLVLALWLNRLGVRVRIIDKTAQPGTTSRALVVHARILEHYDQLGLAEPLVQQATRMSAANLWVRGRKIARAQFGEMGKGLSPFPFALIYPQDAHEQFLVDRLRGVGVEVERRTQLLGFEETGSRVQARIRREDGREESCECHYIAGCDGAHSTVREVLKAGFPGGTYQHMFYVADVKARGPVMNRELNVALDTADFLAVFPLSGPDHARLVGLVRDDAVAQHKTLTWEDVSKSVVERLGIAVEKLNWFSTYHVHHRVANRFRAGRAFLLGDAAHVHSPVGGQGMNTGIGDAVNLAWKLAWVLHGGADPKVLDSYECERRAFALRLVETTDRAFIFATQDGPIARFVRLHVIPRLIPAIFSTKPGLRFMFRTISQTAVNYRGCELSSGAAGKLRGGDRLPWVRLGLPSDAWRDNFEPLRSVSWQMHVYGEADDEATRYCSERKFPLHVFAWRPAMDTAGFARNALYLVRPDGHIASASRHLPSGV